MPHFSLLLFPSSSFFLFFIIVRRRAGALRLRARSFTSATKTNPCVTGASSFLYSLSFPFALSIFLLSPPFLALASYRFVSHAIIRPFRPPPSSSPPSILLFNRESISPSWPLASSFLSSPFLPFSSCFRARAHRHTRAIRPR
jgi:hypothetical protein